MEHIDAIIKLVDAGFTKDEIKTFYGVDAKFIQKSGDLAATPPASAKSDVQQNVQDAPEQSWKEVTGALVTMVKDLQAANRALLNGQSPEKQEQSVDDIMSGFLMNGGFSDGRHNS